MLPGRQESAPPSPPSHRLLRDPHGMTGACSIGVQEILYLDNKSYLIKQMWARLGSQASLSTLALDDDHFEGKDMERTVFNLVPGLPQWLRW